MTKLVLEPGSVQHQPPNRTCTLRTVVRGRAAALALPQALLVATEALQQMAGAQTLFVNLQDRSCLISAEGILL